MGSIPERPAHPFPLRAAVGAELPGKEEIEGGQARYSPESTILRSWGVTQFRTPAGAALRTPRRYPPRDVRRSRRRWGRGVGCEAGAGEEAPAWAKDGGRGGGAEWPGGQLSRCRRYRRYFRGNRPVFFARERV